MIPRESIENRASSVDPPDSKRKPADVPGAIPVVGSIPAAWIWPICALIAVTAIAIRTIALDSDAYARLSWSSALLTDEGFYIHNARNLILFGTERTDQFNNMWIMPTLHMVQVVVFKLFGVGAVNARLISVWSSLLTLPLFFAAIRRAFDMKAALVATLFLALDHINFLYSRLALMDAPASAVLICCLYAFVRGLPSNAEATLATPDACRRQNAELGWMFACGCLLGFAYTTRGLTALAVPCFLGAAWFCAPRAASASRGRYALALLSGLGMVCVVFILVWYLPHHDAISRVNRYYIVDLLLPKSLPHLRSNILEGLFDYQRGAMPYLMRHSPVQFTLASAGIAWAFVTRVGNVSAAPVPPDQQLSLRVRAVYILMAAWMAIYCIFACCVNYAPSRYFVLFYPPMAALAAFSLFETPRIASEFIDRKLLMAIVGSYFSCLIGQALRSRIALIDVKGMYALFLGLVTAFLAGSMMQRGRARSARYRYATGSNPPEIWITGLAIWATVNGYWTADWLQHLSYRQKAADRWLEANLPAGSTLIGAAAPGLCLNNRFKVVNVIVDLCNDGQVVEEAQAPRYIVILDGGAWRERWWDDRYPDLTVPARRIHVFHNLLRPFYAVSVYSVDPPGSASRQPLYLKR